MSEGWSADGEQRDYSGLIAHQTVPPERTVPTTAPRRAVCRAATYDGPVVELTGVVDHVSRDGAWLAFTADYRGGPGRG